MADNVAYSVAESVQAEWLADDEGVHRDREDQRVFSRQLQHRVELASDSPASSAAAASVVLLQERVRRPPGLPDFPFSNGRPRTRPGGFGETLSAIANSFPLTGADPRSRDGRDYVMPIGQFDGRHFAINESPSVMVVL